MFDDDLFNYYSGLTSTETEQEQSKTQQNQFDSNSSYNPYLNQTSTSSYDADYDDDYSVTPNYTEQTSYNPTSQSRPIETVSNNVEVRYKKMDIPVIEKSQETVTLTKTREKVHLQPRMKIAIVMFATIMISLVFAIIWNFVSVGKYNAMIAEKQAVIDELNSSISALQNTYTSLDDENIVGKLEDLGYVKSDETNTYYVSSGDFYTEKAVEDLPSNWFNDVCEFFSGLFAS